MNITADGQVSATPAGAPPTTDHMPQPATITALNHLLTHEMMAAEACRNASAWFERLPVAQVLRQVMDGHHLRAGMLFDSIHALDGIPAVDPHRQEATNAPAMSDARVVLPLLLDLEQRGVALYRQSLGQFDSPIRTMIEAELLPAQETSLASIAGAQPPPADGAV